MTIPDRGWLDWGLHTGYGMLAKAGVKDSHSVIQALIKQSRKLPKELYCSLTWERGSEMAAHNSFTSATDIDVFPCEPHSPLPADC
jgi:transposase, IS30 family